MWDSVSVLMATCPHCRTTIDSKWHKATPLLFCPQNSNAVLTHAITFDYSELDVPSAWYKATVATYNNSTTRRFVPGAVNDNALGNRCHKLLKPSPHYVMIESTLWFDNLGIVPGFLLLLWAIERSHMQSRKRSRRRPVNKALSMDHFQYHAQRGGLSVFSHVFVFSAGNCTEPIV